MITLVKTIRVRDDNTNREFSQDNIKQALIHVISYLLYNNTDNATLHLRTTYIDLAYLLFTYMKIFATKWSWMIDQESSYYLDSGCCCFSVEICRVQRSNCIFVKRLGLGLGTWDLGPRTWDLGPGTWDLGPGNREYRIENTPSPSADSKISWDTHHHPPTP